jgi:hypothetical protein
VGATRVVDFSKDSFAEELGRLACVVDTIGVDADGLAANLKKIKVTGVIR